MRTKPEGGWTKRATVITSCICAAVWLFLDACHSSDDNGVQSCSPACVSGQVCCYTFIYLTPGPDGSAASLTFDAASQEGISAPTCGTLIDYDAGPYDESNAELDGSLGNCGLYPPG